MKLKSLTLAAAALATGLTGSLSAETVMRGWGEGGKEYIDLAFTWKKVDGEWFIHRVEDVQPLRRPETLPGPSGLD